MKILTIFLVAHMAFGQTILSGILVSGGAGSGGTVATPTDSNSGGSCTGSSPSWTCTGTTSVTLADATGGASICFTDDGTTPTAPVAGTCSGGTTQTYSTAISVASTKTIKALGTKVGMTNSGVLSTTYTIAGPTPILSHTLAAGNGTITTTAIDTTTASSLYLAIVSSGATSTANFSDSASNTWEKSTAVAGPGPNTSIFFCNAPSTSSTHTVTYTQAGQFEVVMFVALKTATFALPISIWSSGTTYSQFQLAQDNLDGNPYMSIAGSNIGSQPSTHNGSTWQLQSSAIHQASSTTAQTPAITGVGTNILCITAIGANGGTGGTPFSVDSGYTLLDATPIAGGSNYGGAIAWLTQTSASAVQPTWTMAGSAASMGATNTHIKN